MILHWEQMVLHYGPEIATHRPKFEAAGQTTYGLLCCRIAPDDRFGLSVSVLFLLYQAAIKAQVI